MLGFQTKQEITEQTHLSGQEGAELVRETEKLFIHTVWLTFMPSSEINFLPVGGVPSPGRDTHNNTAVVHVYRPQSRSTVTCVLTQDLLAMLAEWL